MPAVLIVYGAYVATTAAVWSAAAWAAGTMIVSGVMAQKSKDDGDAKGYKNWMMLGTVASIGYGLSSTGGAESAAAGSGAETAATETAAQNSANSAGIDQSMGAASKAGEGTVTTSGFGATNAAGTGATTGVNTGTGTAGDGSLAEYMARSEAKQAAINSNNLKVQTASMGIQAYGAYETGQQQKEVEEKKIAAAKALEDERRANMNNLTSLTRNSVGFLPNLSAGAQKIKQKGLINAPQTAQTLA